MNEEEAKSLIRKYLSGLCTTEEEALVEDWYNEQATLEEMPPLSIDYEAQGEEMLQRLIAHSRSYSKRVHWWQRPAFRWAAAVGLLALSLIIYLLLRPVDRGATGYAAFDNMGAPGGNHATLTLSDGTIVDLDTLRVGSPLPLAGITVNKTKEGELVYVAHPNVPEAGSEKFNTIETPRGGQFQVTLPDGSRAWLNAASSLRYPQHFSGVNRAVRLVGEAYFEVAADSRHPFVVQSGNQQVTVLGTAFNISAYTDEDIAVTTVAAGSVEVADRNSGQSVVLRSGFQSLLRAGKLSSQAVEVADYVSWRDGLIVLHEADLPAILRQISRWYGVTFETEDLGRTGTVYGELKRSVPLSELLESLSANYHVKFRKEEGRIMVYR